MLKIQIIDDFLPDPFKFRKWGLNTTRVVDSIRYRYPGDRFTVNNDVRESIVNIIKKHGNIDITPTDRVFFDFVNGSYGQGIPHADLALAKFTFILFLNPNPPPKSGLEIFDTWERYVYRKSLDKSVNLIDYGVDVKGKFLVSSRNRLDRYFYKRFIKKVVDDQDNRIEIPNKFNRMVIFPSNMIHRAQNYFGKEKKDSRNICIAFVGKPEEHNRKYQ